MQGIDVFLDTYVRIDEGTAVLLCAHRSSVRTASWLFAALAMRGKQPETFVFDEDGHDDDEAVTAAIAALRVRRGARRVAVIVCEPVGPSLTRVLAAAQGDKPERTPIFRISGRTSGLFETGFAPEEDLSDDDLAGLSQGEIDELLALCDAEADGLDGREIEEIYATDDDGGALSDEELAALEELSDSELLELATAWGEEGFRVLA
jgi:hypothetical protein